MSVDKYAEFISKQNKANGLSPFTEARSLDEASLMSEPSKRAMKAVGDGEEPTPEQKKFREEAKKRKAEREPKPNGEVEESSKAKKTAFLKSVGDVEKQAKAASHMYWNSTHHPKDVAGAKAKHDRRMELAKKVYKRWQQQEESYDEDDIELTEDEAKWILENFVELVDEGFSEEEATDIVEKLFYSFDEGSTIVGPAIDGAKDAIANSRKNKLTAKGEPKWNEWIRKQPDAYRRKLVRTALDREQPVDVKNFNEDLENIIGDLIDEGYTDEEIINEISSKHDKEMIRSGLRGRLRATTNSLNGRIDAGWMDRNGFKMVVRGAARLATRRALAASASDGELGRKIGIYQGMLGKSKKATLSDKVRALVNKI